MVEYHLTKVPRILSGDRINGVEKQYSHEKVKFDSHPPILHTWLTKINLNLIKDLNAETIKFLNISKSCFTQILATTFFFFLIMTPMAQTTNVRINKWDYITVRIFCSARETIDEKATHRTVENIFKLHIW